MGVYFIKTFYPPTHLPDDRYAAFTERGRNQAERFRNCAGFLAYETSAGENGVRGAMRIFAHGTIRKHTEVEPLHPPILCNGKKYDRKVWVSVAKSVPAERGLPLKTIYELCPQMKKRGAWQKLGGIIEIKKEAFEALKAALDALP